jgi:hypothetical protein
LTLLFVLASPEYLRFFDTTMALLAERGHELHVVFEEAAEYKPVGLTGAGSLPLASVTVMPPARTFWSDTAFAYRAVVDFLRYLHPDYADADVLRERIRRKVLPAACQWLARMRRVPAHRLDAWLAALRFAERALPVDPRVRDTLHRLRPDLVIVSPLVDAASAQVDWIKGAQRAAVPAAVAVASWDNLTNKGLMRIDPDRVFVWNDVQRHEAVRYHAVPAERIVVTGAAVFDRWFDRHPFRSRQAFCSAAGLPDDRRFVLFTGSSAFIAEGEDELAFVRRWVAALRSSSDPSLAGLRVLIRPHPYNTAAWSAAAFGDSRISVWPRGPFNPATEHGRRDLFDSLYHAAAIVGINTSAMIEAAIVGRPVLTIDEFATQRGTLHFGYLLQENGGPVAHSGTMTGHLGQLAWTLRAAAAERPAAAEAAAARATAEGVALHASAEPTASRASAEASALRAPSREQLHRFVESFVRPQGRGEPSAPRLAQAVLDAAALRVTRRSDAGAVLLMRPPLLAFGVWVALVARLTGPDPFVPLRKQLVHPLRVVRRRTERQIDLLTERTRRRARLTGNRLRRAGHVARAGMRQVPAMFKRWRRALRHARYAAGMLRRGESPIRHGKS